MKVIKKDEYSRSPLKKNNNKRTLELHVTILFFSPARLEKNIIQRKYLGKHIFHIVLFL